MGQRLHAFGLESMGTGVARPYDARGANGVIVTAAALPHHHSLGVVPCLVVIRMTPFTPRGP
jgi:hypothetical protein